MTASSRLSLAEGFDRYERFAPSVPVWRVTAPDRAAIHRFYDTSPISPSGRYLAATELPYEDRSPGPEDPATVVVFDLDDGKRVFEAATTAWDTQVGAHVQWGASDRQLLFNRRAGEAPPFAVVVDPATAIERPLDGAVYVVSPDGRETLAPDLRKLALVQAGYGVRSGDPERFRHVGAPSDDGLYATSVDDGATRRVVSFAELVARAPRAFEGLDLARGGLYGFHVKWHPSGDRVLFMVRWLAADRAGGRTRNVLLAMDPDGSAVREVVGWRRWGTGHHPNWWPIAHDVIMNLSFSRAPDLLARVGRRAARSARRLGLRLPDPGGLRFAQIPTDGRPPRPLHPGLRGSGHPSIDPTERFLLTDAYPDESVAFGDGTVPIRLLDLDSGHERVLARVRTRPEMPGTGAEWRVDPHPAWSRDGCWIAFNACPDGVRGVFVADLRAIVATRPVAGAS